MISWSIYSNLKFYDDMLAVFLWSSLRLSINAAVKIVRQSQSMWACLAVCSGSSNVLKQSFWHSENQTFNCWHLYILIFRKVVAPAKGILGYMDASSVLCEFEAIDVSSIMQITKVEIFFVDTTQVVGKLKSWAPWKWGQLAFLLNIAVSVFINFSNFYLIRHHWST